LGAHRQPEADRGRRTRLHQRDVDAEGARAGREPARRVALPLALAGAPGSRHGNGVLGRAGAGRGALRRARPSPPAADGRLAPRGAPTAALGPRAARLGHLAEVQETPPPCPEDWGALRVRPQAVELWSEAEDRIHERRLFARDGEGWALTLLSP